MFAKSKAGSSIPGSGNGDEDAAIDMAHLDRYTMGDAALKRELLDLFRQQMGIQREALATAKSNQQWFYSAHSLKGAARSLGAFRLADIAREFEMASHPVADGVRKQLFLRLDHELRKCMVTIDAID